MSVIDDIRTILQADATVMSLLTGGIYDRTTISRQNTPEAFDVNLEVRPCALINIDSETPAGPYANSAATYVRIFYYQQSGFDDISAARERIFTLLNQVRVGGGWEMRWVADIPGQNDPDLKCSLEVSRFVKYRRK